MLSELKLFLEERGQVIGGVGLAVQFLRLGSGLAAFEAGGLGYFGDSLFD